MPDNPIETAADALADASDALGDAAAQAGEDTEQETATLAGAPVVIMQGAAAPVASAEPAAMQPHEHPEIATALSGITERLEALAKPATDPIADAIAPVAEPVVDAVADAIESAPKKTHWLFRPILGGKA